MCLCKKAIPPLVLAEDEKVADPATSCFLAKVAFAAIDAHGADVTYGDTLLDILASVTKFINIQSPSVYVMFAVVVCVGALFVVCLMWLLCVLLCLSAFLSVYSSVCLYVCRFVLCVPRSVAAVDLARNLAAKSVRLLSKSKGALPALQGLYDALFKDALDMYEDEAKSKNKSQRLKVCGRAICCFTSVSECAGVKCCV
ncbi:MAG: hypothetical protein P4L40_07625, partial [Terracidiphilus sp.]|nr:hypothetical protein [Terracidiphilus sp.]